MMHSCFWHMHDLFRSRRISDNARLRDEIVMQVDPSSDGYKNERIVLLSVTKSITLAST